MRALGLGLGTPFRTRAVAGGGAAVDTSLALDLDFAAMTTLDPRVTFTRAGPAMMYDATGKLTTAPNNQVGFSNEFTQASWAKENVSITTGITDPDGGTSASTMTVTGGTTHTNRRIYWGNPIGAGTTNKYVYSVWIRRRSGTGAIYISGGAGYTDITSQVSGTWARVFSAAAPLYHLVALAGAPGEAVDIWRTQVDHVTYEITPRTYIPTTTSAAVYGPRFDHDPATLQPRGLLLEEQRTNVLLHSAAMTTGPAWTQFFNGSATGSWTANAGTAPDGTTTAALATINRAAAGDWAQVFCQIFTATITTWTMSVWLKAYTAGDVGKVIDFCVYNNTTLSPITNVTLTANWVRHSITGAFPNAVPVSFLLGYMSDMYPGVSSALGPVQFLAWGAQAEVGSFATSYVPTTTAAVTRAADSASMSGTGFSSWYNQAEGTFVITASDAGLKSAFYINANNAGWPGDRICLYCEPPAALMTFIAAAGPAQSNDVVGTLTANTVFKAGYAVKANDTASCLNGAAPVVDTTVIVPTTLNRLELGADETGASGKVARTHFQRLTYYNTRKSNAELQTLTAP